MNRRAIHAMTIALCACLTASSIFCASAAANQQRIRALIFSKQQNIEAKVTQCEQHLHTAEQLCQTANRQTDILATRRVEKMARQFVTQAATLKKDIKNDMKELVPVF
jgi:hypothetical protein